MQGTTYSTLLHTAIPTPSVPGARTASAGPCGNVRDAHAHKPRDAHAGIVRTTAQGHPSPSSHDYAHRWCPLRLKCIRKAMPPPPPPTRAPPPSAPISTTTVGDKDPEPAAAAAAAAAQPPRHPTAANPNGTAMKKEWPRGCGCAIVTYLASRIRFRLGGPGGPLSSRGFKRKGT